jgi:hypothetical protein
VVEAETGLNLVIVCNLVIFVFNVSLTSDQRPQVRLENIGWVVLAVE